MSVNIILATDLNYGIGNENKLPWPRNRKDMEWFRRNTLGHVVVMGRKTWESLGRKSLSGRKNVVVSSKNFPHPKIGGPDHVASGNMDGILKTILPELYPGLDIWVIGGAEIYHQSIPHADKLYLTTFNRYYKCDTYVESDITTKFPIVEYREEDGEVTFQIRNKGK